MQKRLLALAALCLLLFAAGCAQQTQGAGDVQQENTAAVEGADVMEFSMASASSAGAATPEAHAGVVPPASPSSLPAAPSPALSSEPTPSPTLTPAPSPTPPYALTDVKDVEGYIKGHDVNLREGPGTEYEKIGEMGYHTVVTITDKTEEWYRIEKGDVCGFLLKEFVGVGGIPTPTPKPTAKPKATAKPTPKPAVKPTAEPTPEPEIEKGGEGDYTEDEIYLAARLIYAEGKSQSTESFLAMASVLYNRCNSSRFGGTVKQEVYRSGQFSVVDNSGFESLVPSSAALSAAKRVFLEGERTLPAGVMYFRSASKGKQWSGSRTFYKTIGGNNYYY